MAPHEVTVSLIPGESITLRTLSYDPEDPKSDLGVLVTYGSVPGLTFHELIRFNENFNTGFKMALSEMRLKASVA